MRDVAALAGVSVKTVSRVINDEAGVSEHLLTRVRRAAEQLDYRPDFSASNLRRADRRTSTLGLLVEDVANEFSAAVHAGVEDAARGRGIAVLTASIADDATRERDAVRALAHRRVDGLIVVPSGAADSSLWNDREVGIPIVFVDRAPRGVTADCVLTNNYDGTVEGMRHLLQSGHRDIAFLGGVSHLDTAQQRYEGYTGALADAGVAMRPQWVARDLRSPNEATEAVRTMLANDPRPTAIFAAQNLLSMGAFRALREAGSNRTIALVGFDDFALADLLDPAITVVAQDPRAIGRRAAELLFERMADGSDAPRRLVVPSRLIVRESSLIPPPPS
jgi:LacI family transcriptional regulator